MNFALSFNRTSLRLGCWSLLLCAGFAVPGLSQPDPAQIQALLEERIVSPEVSLFQLRRHLLQRMAPPPAPASAPQWARESRKLREHLLKEVVFHGWPRAVVQSPPRFEEAGVIETGQGYRIRKFRFEIVPGFYSTALLYEPDNVRGRVPAILNVNGHVGAAGKAIEYKQKRCINFARRGWLALNLEWLGCGELFHPENRHWFGAHLDLVGAHEAGLFYLAMRRGLDYLCAHPAVDRSRVGMTGLSGGGWQTITLSALDERVRVAVPVAGFSALQSRIEARRFGDLGDVEQTATDLFAGRDYTHLVALLAPRPTLLIYNAEDDCCFRAALVKPHVYDAVRPVFRLFDAEESFQWHENLIPGTHNYELDNRLAAYRFFSQQFRLPPITGEIDVAAEVKSYDELAVGLPKDNLTILGLARKLGREIVRPSVPVAPAARKKWAGAERAKLKQVIRYQPARLTRPWAVACTKSKGLESAAFLLEMDNGLCANAVWLRALNGADRAPLTMLLNDKGKRQTAAEVLARITLGEQVLATDLVFTGDAWEGIRTAEHQQFIHGLGERSLGLIVAQLIETARWSRQRAEGAPVRLECRGLRSQAAALAAAALEPTLFPEIVIHDGIPSLNYLLEKPVSFTDAPELFCLDLLRHFDLDRWEAMAGETRVIVGSFWGASP